MSYRKTALEKLATKLNTLEKKDGIIKVGNKYNFGDETLLEFNNLNLNYGTKRYYSNLTEPIKEDKFSVKILVNQDNLSLLNSNLINPPKGVKRFIDSIKELDDVDIETIYLGYKENKFENNTLFITKELYENILLIDREEGKDKRKRVFNRLIPFLKSEFGIDTTEIESDRNYSLLLKEIIASNEFTQQDIIEISKNLEIGNPSQIVIKKQIHKQVEWLILTIEEILKIDNLTKQKAQQIGKSKFGFLVKDISGPEHLMEKILSTYGQYALFGVPVLINSNKYVKHKGVSRSQFDILLVNHLGDIEIVELKRPDQILFDYDPNRGKFYPKKELAIAISQTERYISAFMKDNDDEYIISDMKIRDFINEQIGIDIYFESIRPTAIIIIGSWGKMAKSYNSLSLKTKSKVSQESYENNLKLTYKELKNSFKNIKIMTYSELLDVAKTRLEITKENQ